MEEDHLERVRHVDLELLEQAARGDAGRTQVVNQPGLEIHLPYVPISSRHPHVILLHTEALLQRACMDSPMLESPPPR